jgi:2,6-dihydroxypyridine 3-monooxygenase
MGMPRVGIVGGSLAGLTAACLLRDIGCEVEVFERSPAPLSGFGTGIVVQPELVRYFLERTPITLERISVPSEAIRYFNAEDGSLLGEVRAHWRYTSYNALYNGLLQSFGMARYRLGHALVSLEQAGGGVTLGFANGRAAEFDLAVCADGSFSTARALMLGVSPRYSGYITWRGLAPRERLTREAWDTFDNRFTYGLLNDGHLIAYPIPVPGGHLGAAERCINFQWYWNVPEGEALDRIMTGADGVRRPVSVHADALPRAAADELRQRASERIAFRPFVDLIGAADKPFVTIIADCDVPRMVEGRACLVGDASIAGRPHAAAGGAKAALNAWALAEALQRSGGEVTAALAAWEPEQLRQGRHLLAKVRYMGGLLQHGGRVVPGDPLIGFGMPARDHVFLSPAV